VLNPARAAWVDARLRSRYVRESALDALDYAFFPLHTEPELSLLLHSRPNVNQVEAARGIARSLPVGMQLVIKEHPWSVGKRSLGYYEKLLEIPNVRLADPAMSSTPLVRGARLVVTIASSIGFEAALEGKPVVTLGSTSYDVLPASMVRRVTRPDMLAAEISELLAQYHYDEGAVVRYVKVVLEHSAPVNLYSNLLGRRGVHVPGQSTDASTDLDRLTALACKALRSNDELAVGQRESLEGAVAESQQG
jgi:hypothetical protein